MTQRSGTLRGHQHPGALQGYPTNVVKMVQAITPLDDSQGNPIRQIIYYDEGIGTKQSNTEVTDTLIVAIALPLSRSISQ